MEQEEYKKAYSVYNQTFGTPSGMEVLADLKRNFIDKFVLPTGVPAQFEFECGARYAIQYIFEKMKLADKRKFADIMREIELIEPIGKEM